MENRDTGLLLHKNDIQLHRKWFKEMCKLIGVISLYRSPISSYKTFNTYGELDAHYNPPIPVGCIFDEHPTIWTMKKLGWDSEQADKVSIIHVPYDLSGLQAGALFILPSGIDGSEGRVFRVVRMSTTYIYPASIACELAPEWENTQEASEIEDFTHSDMNLLVEEGNFK